MSTLLRQHAEQQFAEELHELKQNETNPVPENWEMSPQSVVTYLMGGKLKNGFEVSPKYIGNRRLMEIAVATLVTDEEGVATSGDIPIASYKDGKMKKEIEYILVETKAPDGYVRSEKEESIVFTYQDDKTKEIEITKELTNERIPTGDYVKSPKTGDDTNIWLPILLLVLSVGGIAGIFWYTKKKNHEE